MLDIGIIIPELEKYGGAERYLLECVTRWQDQHRITLYASRINMKLLKECGIKRKVATIKIHSYFQGEHSVVLNCLLLPKIWEREINVHDVYFGHVCPTHLIDLHPMVWVVHEPHRFLYDLQYNLPINVSREHIERSIHVYPRYNYDELASDFISSIYRNALYTLDHIKNPDAIVTNSHYSAAYVKKVYKRKSDGVIYPGINPEDFKHSPGENGVILTIGQLWAHKRIDLIIDSMKFVKNIKLYIVGDGPEKTKLKKQAKKLGLTDKIFFLEKLTNKKLQLLLSRCMAFVFTPIREPFGIVILEAMASGKPVIAVNEGGYREVMNDFCGFLVNPYPEEIAKKIKFLKDNSVIAKKMGLAGLKLSRKYTWDKTANQMLTLIKATHKNWVDKNKKKELVRTDLFPLIGTQYYCWYGDGIGSSHWNDDLRYGGVTDMPRLSYYASSYETTITEHFKILKESGVDFIILNLHIDKKGINLYELATIEHIFDLAEKRNIQIKLAIQLCIYGFKNKKIKNLLNRLDDFFTKKPNYLRLGKKPVLFYFWSGFLDGARNKIKFLRKNTSGFVNIAGSLRMFPIQEEHKKTFGFFDGFYLFSPLEISSKENWEKLWQESFRDSNAGKMHLRILTVSPGYDDSHLKDPHRKNNPYRIISRDNGKTYKRMLDFSLSIKAMPHMVMISSFNEYHENTHIEPSVNFKTKYMTMTKNFIKQIKTKWQRKCA